VRAEPRPTHAVCLTLTPEITDWLLTLRSGGRRTHEPKQNLSARAFALVTAPLCRAAGAEHASAAPLQRCVAGFHPGARGGAAGV
jgi:hypothetical protein